MTLIKCNQGLFIYFFLYLGLLLLLTYERRLDYWIKYTMGFGKFLSTYSCWERPEFRSEHPNWETNNYLLLQIQGNLTLFFSDVLPVYTWKAFYHTHKHTHENVDKLVFIVFMTYESIRANLFALGVQCQ